MPALIGALLFAACVVRAVPLSKGDESQDKKADDSLSKWDVNNLFKQLISHNDKNVAMHSKDGAGGKAKLVMKYDDVLPPETPKEILSNENGDNTQLMHEMRDLDKAERERIQPRSTERSATDLGTDLIPSAEPALVWYGPVKSKSGFAAEARYYATSISEVLQNFYTRHYGDVPDDSVLETLPVNEMVTVMGLLNKPDTTGNVVSVCHSTPTHWFGDSDCPPPNSAFRIGRAMFETDGMPPGWADQCNLMDEVWVPSKWNVETFAKAGVERRKLFVVPEPVDTENKFNPENVGTPYPLPVPPRNDANLPALQQLMQVFAQTNAAAKTAVATTAESGAAATPKTVYKFLSIFKWHKRKGVDVLLRAYCEEFRADEPVALYIKSQFYHEDPESALESQLREISDSLKNNDLPRIKLLNEWIPDTRLPALYKAADAFVLPSRGEGWGLPVAEAMSMGLPAIATDWSGTTEFLNKDVGRPVKYTLRDLSPEDGEDMYTGGANELSGHKYAEPSVEDLRKQMRWVYDNRADAKKLGAAAREHMRRNYSPPVIARLVTHRVKEVAPQLAIH